MKTKYIIQVFLSIPKILVFNFKVLPFCKAIKLPFYVNYKTKFYGITRNSIVLAEDACLRTFMVKFGNSGSHGIIEHRYNSLYISEGGKMKIHGAASFNLGFSIRIENEGVLTIGKSFNMNRNGLISCSKSITFGDTVLIGWNVSIRDSDGHTLIVDGEKKPTLKPVVIGNHVWIGAETHILKGSHIGDDCVIAYKSLVSNYDERSNVLWAGAPARIIKEDIEWESTPWDEKKKYY